MASASVEDEMLDYTEEELEEILKDVEKFEREDLGESDIEVGNRCDEEMEVDSDPEDDVPLASLQTTWRPATHATQLREFEQPTGLNHNLPGTAKPLDYFFCVPPTNI